MKTKRITKWMLGLAPLIGPLLLCGLAYWTWCWGWWGQNRYFRYFLQCECPAASEEARYPDDVDVLVSACEDPDLSPFGQLASPSGRYTIFSKRGEQDVLYLYDRGTDSVTVMPSRSIYAFLDEDLLLQTEPDKSYALYNLAGQQLMPLNTVYISRDALVPEPVLDILRREDFHSTPELPAQADVVVIGGGLTGVSIAYWLGRNGLAVTLIERRGLSGGATGRNGGHLVPGPAELFGEAIKRYGLATARAIFDFSLATTAALRAFVAEHKVDCDLALDGTAYLALHPDELPRLQETAEQMSAHGFPGLYWDAATCAEQTHSDHFLGGLFQPNAGKLWPAKLVFAIAEQAMKFGANIQTQTEGLAVQREGDRLIVKTSRGDTRARYVVHATNAWASRLLPFLKDVIVPVRGQVVLTEPAPALWPFGLVTNFGYEYFIQRPDGRIVLGGMRWKSLTMEIGNDDDTTVNSVVGCGLREFLPEHFPALKDIQVEMEWAGIMGFTPDLNPLVGPVPGRAGEYVAAGFSGHGMPFAFFAGKAIAEMIAGQQPEVFVDAFLPSRFHGRD